MEFSESSHIHRTEKVQEAAGYLLEEAWFFGNSLDTKTKSMSRCYSHPIPSSNCNQQVLVNSVEAGQFIQKPCMMVSEEDEDDLESEFTMGRLIRQASFNSSQMSRSKQNSKVMKKAAELQTQYRMGNEEKLFRRKQQPCPWQSPPPPSFPGKSSAEDMKAQIKFWARAVASNVRQEC